MTAGVPYGIPYTPPGAGVSASPQAKYVAAKLDTGLGLMVANLGTPRLGAAWSVTRVTLNHSVTCKALLYVGTAGDRPSYVDGTNSGQADTSDYAVPLYVPSGQGLFVVWQTATGTGGARVEYVETTV